MSTSGTSAPAGLVSFLKEDPGLGSKKRLQGLESIVIFIIFYFRNKEIKKTIQLIHMYTNLIVTYNINFKIHKAEIIKNFHDPFTKSLGDTSCLSLHCLKDFNKH